MCLGFDALKSGPDPGGKVKKRVFRLMNEDATETRRTREWMERGGITADTATCCVD